VEVRTCSDIVTTLSCQVRTVNHDSSDISDNKTIVFINNKIIRDNSIEDVRDATDQGITLSDWNQYIEGETNVVSC